MAEFEKINDYSITTQNIIPSRFSGKPGYEVILSSSDKQLNDLDVSGESLCCDMWIDTAEGVNLDIIGNYVGLQRFGRDDGSYRSLIKLKIDINVGSGQPELLIRAVKELYGATVVHYIPNYPAGVIIQQNGSIGLFILTEMEIDDGSFLLLDDGNPLFLREPNGSGESILDLIVPAGVELQIVSI